ncbi:MAG: metallophosphoesterase family protein [Dehalococcoidales bacterium]|nr:metallophosphoesterase family protein [Dehalococcoidales bacterium]
MKRICVLGDTHVRHWQQLSKVIKSAISGADYILHLGDYVSLELLETFKKLNNFHGVTGNHDGPTLKALIPEKDIIEIEGRRLGLVHGHGCFLQGGMRRGLLKRFRGEKLDAILYGHTHRMKNTIARDTLFFNPGSAVGRFPASRLSYGILTLNGTLTSELVTVEKPIMIADALYLPHHW